MTSTLTIGDVVLTRVLYLDAPIDPALVGLSVEDVRSVTWGAPLWAEGDQVRAAACAWVVQSGGRTIVVDPSGNIDDILHDPETTNDHQRAFSDAFVAAGIDPASVDTVLLSHIESVGLTAVRAPESVSGWRPFFPNARVLMSDSAQSDFGPETTTEIVFAAFDALRADALVDTFLDGAEVAPGVWAEWTGAHNPGHTAFHIGGAGAPGATFVGHLAVTPLHLATGPCAAQHYEPDRAWEWLQSVAADGRWLIGPLWPSPGAVQRRGDRFVEWESARS